MIIGSIDIPLWVVYAVIALVFVGIELVSAGALIFLALALGTVTTGVIDEVLFALQGKTLGLYGALAIGAVLSVAFAFLLRRYFPSGRKGSKADDINEY
ncbi:NfeD family protein [Radicibacter daui]|uniref:NfeD family protein n=1 Tax=Radicibacter daui TaxID=3064829 RepID=UPI004046EBAD